MEKIVKPLLITNPETNEEYTLEFSRSSVDWAERHGFNLNAIEDMKIASFVSDFFYYAFRMHHPNMTKTQTDTLLFDKEKGLGGIPNGLVDRLADLYAETYNSLIQSEEDSKNSKWTIVL